ncbi:hypothetical protein TSUD_327120 [Trifolium subterraneum]|uniref:HORMA domain-containing protein n=1 Tax=Trifolium subterraneum TaxID=3900 RepID=A0A2Z6P6L7_TRISU|nr:hypothetical protein TSUD_327120 [Trifolium subterraneum]
MRSSACKMIRTLVQLMRTLEKMPEESTILMKLLYYDDATGAAIILLLLKLDLPDEIDPNCYAAVCSAATVLVYWVEAENFNRLFIIWGRSCCCFWGVFGLHGLEESFDNANFNWVTCTASTKIVVGYCVFLASSLIS